MRFEGYNIKPWTLSSSILTLCTIVSFFIEKNLHDNYKQLEKGVTQEVYDNNYNIYRASNYIKIGLLNTAILGWTITGFQFTRNKSLKKRIYGSTSE